MIVKVGYTIRANRFYPGAVLSVYGTDGSITEIRVKAVYPETKEIRYVAQRWYHRLWDHFMHKWIIRKCRSAKKS